MVAEVSSVAEGTKNTDVSIDPNCIRLALNGTNVTPFRSVSVHFGSEILKSPMFLDLGPI